MESNWIKVKDRLPEPHQDVLVYFRYECIEYMEKGRYDPSLGIIAYGMHISQEEYQDKITHWTALPSPPE